MNERGNTFLKFIDYYCGIPLVYLGGLFRSKKQRVLLQKNSENRFLLIKTAAIGDTVLLSAIIREIRDKYPKAIITLVCTANNQAAAELLEGLSDIHVFDLKSPLASFAALAKLPCQDFILDFGAWPRINSLITYFIKGKYKVGFKRVGQYRHYIYDKPVEHRDDIHELENYRNLLSATGITPVGFKPQITYKADAEGRSSTALVLLHPFPGGSGKELKEWPLESWCEVGTYLASQGYTLAVSGGKEDAAQAEWLAEQLNNGGAEAESLAGKLTLTELCEFISHAKLLISVNTGIMHLGAATGVPIVALHGPTSPIRWGPLARQAVNLTPSSSCAPCISLGFEYQCTTGGCMKTITVDAVKKAAKSLLSQTDL